MDPVWVGRWVDVDPTWKQTPADVTQCSWEPTADMQWLESLGSSRSLQWRKGWKMNTDNISKNNVLSSEVPPAYVRFVADLPVSVIRNAVKTPARMRNLSAGGMLVEIEGAATVGDISIRVRLPGMDPVVLPVSAQVRAGTSQERVRRDFSDLPEKVF
jgi:hypothetical protein